MHRIRLHKDAHTCKTSSLVDAGGAFIEGENEESERLRREMFASIGQASLDKRQAQALTGEIRPHPQTNVDNPILTIQSWHFVTPDLSRRAVTEKANQLARLVPHSVMWAASL